MDLILKDFKGVDIDDIAIVLASNPKLREKLKLITLKMKETVDSGKGSIDLFKDDIEEFRKMFNEIHKPIHNKDQKEYKKLLHQKKKY